MFDTPGDFRDESEALYQLLSPLSDDRYETATLFKSWTLNDILHHLHMWNYGADLALADEPAFLAHLDRLGQAANAGTPMRQFEADWCKGATGRQLLEDWRAFYLEMTPRFEAADPKKRVKWAGPDMSVRSSITARLMETWSHAQAIYDVLGVKRVDGDRIKNVCVIGLNTFGWTFVNRGLDVPESVPHLRLTAPSGELWEFAEPNPNDQIEGSATEFCQVVTQVRNIADTDLAVTGPAANAWMEIAQCFAGPPEDPPPPGARHIAG